MPLPDKFNLSGTPEQIAIVLPILEAMYLGFKDLKAEGGGGGAVQELPPKRRGKLKVSLHFVEDFKEVEPGYYPVEGQIGFRLMKDDMATITLARIQEIGTKIKTKFNNFIWKKGKVMCTYTDWDKGYQFQLPCIDANEGWKVTEQVLDIQSHSPEDEFFNYSVARNPGSRFPTIPEKETIAGVSIRGDRRRPIANVRFSHASIYFPVLKRPIQIVDAQGVVITRLPSLKTG